jgi:hypothetical protein
MRPRNFRAVADPDLPSLAEWGHSRTPICADVRFVRPNTPIYDAYVVDLYQSVRARYRVGVKGAGTKATAVKLGSRSNFRKDRWLPNPVPRGGLAEREELGSNLLRLAVGWDPGGPGGAEKGPSPRRSLAVASRNPSNAPGQSRAFSRAFAKSFDE